MVMVGVVSQDALGGGDSHVFRWNESLDSGSSPASFLMVAFLAALDGELLCDKSWLV